MAVAPWIVSGGGRRYRVFEPHASEHDVAQRPEQERLLQDNAAGRRLLRVRLEPADRSRVNVPRTLTGRSTIGAVEIFDPFTDPRGLRRINRLEVIAARLWLAGGVF